MSEFAERPWLDHYPVGTSHTIDPERFASLLELLDQTFKQFADRPAFSNMGHTLTFADVDMYATRLAGFFQTEWGLKKGDRIVLQMPNLLQYPIALFAALRAGLAVVNVNPLYTAREMEHPLRDSGATAIVILENFASKLEEAMQGSPIKHIMLTEVGDMLPMPKRLLTNFVVRRVRKMVPPHRLASAVRFRAGIQHEAGAFQAPRMGPADTAFLQYTGGTTGVSKAAILTHRNIVSNVLQTRTWLGGGLEEGKATVIAALPLYHVFCLTVNCLALLHHGCHNVLITNPRDTKAFLETLAASRPEAMTAISTLIASLLNHADFTPEHAKTLKITVCGGMALNSATANAWRERTKASLIEGYGLTEASPLVACNPLDGRDQLGTIGMPVPSTDIRILDDAGKPQPMGQPGELCVKGPQVMPGYWNQPEETRKVLDEDGWLHTGDIATLGNDGFLRIVDRKKDMILVSGFNVYPNEVEDVVAHHPKVLEVAAIGVPDQHSGEVVKLFVVKRQPDLTEADLITWCHDKLTGYKRPKHVEFRDALPKSNVGKIIRRELRS